MFQAVGALGYVLAQNLAGFYAAAALFGFIYARYAALRRDCARELPSSDDGHGDWRLGHGRQPGHGGRPGGRGLIYDAVRSYRWPYIGSSAIDLGPS